MPYGQLSGFGGLVGDVTCVLGKCQKHVHSVGGIANTRLTGSLSSLNARATTLLTLLTLLNLYIYIRTLVFFAVGLQSGRMGLDGFPTCECREGDFQNAAHTSEAAA